MDKNVFGIHQCTYLNYYILLSYLLFLHYFTPQLWSLIIAALALLKLSLFASHYVIMRSVERWISNYRLALFHSLEIPRLTIVILTRIMKLFILRHPATQQVPCLLLLYFYDYFFNTLINMNMYFTDQHSVMAYKECKMLWINLLNYWNWICLLGAFLHPVQQWKLFLYIKIATSLFYKVINCTFHIFLQSCNMNQCLSSGF